MTPNSTTVLFIAALLPAIACHETSEQRASPSVPPAVLPPTASVVAVTDSTPASHVDTVPAAALDTTLVTADSLLPKQSYEGVPGWLALGIRHPSFKVGDVVKGQTLTTPMLIVDSGIAVFPVNDAWRGVNRGTPLVFINPTGEKSDLYADGEAVWEGSGDATVVRVRAKVILNSVGWLVPRSKAADVTALPIGESMSGDRNTRTWTAGDSRIRVQRTGKLEADVIAEARGLSVKRKSGAAINLQADSSMGVESDTLLDLRSQAHVPDFFAAYHFASSRSTVFIFVEGGYECTNYRVVVFRPSRIDWIEEPHYTGQCTQ